MSRRILMFGWEFPPHNSGGLGTACLGLSRALSQESELIFVLPKKIPTATSRSRMVYADQNTEENVTFRHIDTILAPYVTEESYRYEHGKVIKSVALDEYGTSLMDEVKRYALRARKIAKEESFDIIHAHDWLSFLAGLEARRVSGKPLVIHVHATEIDRTGGQGANQDIFDIEHHAMHEADAIITVSEWTKKTIVEHYNIDPRKVEVVHNGIDTRDWPDPNIDFDALKRAGKKIVLFLGRITIQKGPEYFVRAAKMVAEHNKDAVFVVAGSGDMESQMLKEIAALGLGDRFIFTGFIRGDEATAMFRAAHVFVMPSVSEPFGITPLEAIVNGTPVIISKQSGVAEVVDHALKVDFWDVDEIANMILCTLNYDSLSQTLLSNSSQEVKRITWESAAQKCISLYEKVLSPLKSSLNHSH